MDVTIDDKKYYVTNKALMEELEKWRASAEKIEDRVITEELGRMIYAIATHLTFHNNFRRYSEDLKSDMISYGCFKSLVGLKSYNFEYKNPFAYFTQICWNANVSICGKYYKRKNMIKEQMINAASELANNSIIGTTRSQYIAQLQMSLQDFLDELDKSEQSSDENDDDNED